MTQQAQAAPESPPESLTLLSQPLAGPWPRFWARLFDITLLSLVLATLLHSIGPAVFGEQFLLDPSYDGLLSLALLPFVFLLDAFIQFILGNSVGKAIAGIQVQTTGLERPDLGQSVERNFLVWVKGVGLGIPIVSLFAMMACYMTVKSGRLASWDANCDTRVISKRSSIYRTLLIFFATLALFAGLAALNVLSSQAFTAHSPTEIAKANEGLPLQIDEHLRLDSIEDDAGVVTYTYTLVNTKGAPSLTPTQMSGLNSESFRAVFVEGYCHSDPSGQRPPPAYAARYRYRTVEGVVVTEFTLTPQSCAGDGL